jgi:hypothetical protein
MQHPPFRVCDCNGKCNQGRECPAKLDPLPYLLKDLLTVAAVMVGVLCLLALGAWLE